MATLKRAPLVALTCFLCAATSSLTSGPDAGRFDGPAELPRFTVKRALSDTPAPGKILLVKEGDNLQRALDAASCGDTIRLQPGATFPGTFSLPAKACDDQHWIILRSDASDSSLPPEGTRLTPCYAGVASLPGRPAYPCNSPKNVLPKIVFRGKAGSGPIILESGANHYRLLALEITRDSSGANVTNLVSFRNGGRQGDGAVDWNTKGDHIVYDRLWIHGDEKDETTRGLQLGGTTYVAVVDSYFNDLKCIALTGACTDAQAISGGTGDNPMGPYKIENNFLEASGQSIMFGGARGTATPTDIEIRRNHLFKPFTWKADDPAFMPANSGKPFIVKNIFELKNAQRVLFENNILENSWGGFSQAGFAILLTPKSQSANLCPMCRVTDVTIRYSRISHCASGFLIANIQSAGNGISTAGERYSIHDVVLDDLDNVRYKGNGVLFQFSSFQPPLRDIKIDHLTGFAPRVLFNLGVLPPSPKIANFTFTNNLVSAGEHDVTSTGGGPSNCSYQPQKQSTASLLESCFGNPTVTHNVILNPQGIWPKENFTPKNGVDAGLRTEKPATLRDFQLCREKNESAGCKKPSPFLQAGTDGKPVGADIDAIDAGTAGVQ